MLATGGMKWKQLCVLTDDVTRLSASKDRDQLRLRDRNCRIFQNTKSDIFIRCLLTDMSSKLDLDHHRSFADIMWSIYCLLSDVWTKTEGLLMFSLFSLFGYPTLHVT